MLSVHYPYAERVSECLTPDNYNKLEEIFSQTCVDPRFFETSYKIHVLVSFRTDLTNELLVHDQKVFWEQEYTTDYFDDIALEAMSSAFRSIFPKDYYPLIASRTVPTVIGAVKYGGEIYVYAVVAMDNKLRNEDFFSIPEKDYFIPIEVAKSMCTDTADFDLMLLNSLVLVNKEVND